MNTFSSSAPVFALESIAFFGRSFDEYLRFFSLAPSDLTGRTVLDVAAGTWPGRGSNRRCGRWITSSLPGPATP
jgi:hypothetical protein